MLGVQPARAHPSLRCRMREDSGERTPLALSTSVLRSKVQNAKRDKLTALKTIQKSGLEVMRGFIVGFDSDKPNVFERQIRFIQEAGVVTAMVGLLQALPGTRLFSRLKQEGHIWPKTKSRCSAFTKRSRTR